jgi:hypothetical protein
MKRIILFAVAFGSALLASPHSSSKESSSSSEVLDKFNAAYNAHDLDAVMSFFTPDSELIQFPDKVLAKGIEELRKRYAARLKEPNLHVEVINRIVAADKVIDHERIVRTFPEGPGLWDIVAIIEVRDRHVAKLYFIEGGKTLAEPASAKKE